MTKVLVTGGAGFIGSVTTDLLIERGDQVVVVDDLSRGFVESINEDALFVPADIGDVDAMSAVVGEHRPDAVIHFAGFIAVGESVTDPGPYLDRNVGCATRLLDVLVAHEVHSVVFSSSAAVYGAPDLVPIREDAPKRPTSPYGWTKQAFEDALGFYGTAHGVRSVSLRYFNAAGATAVRRERHDPETHLIPNILAAAAGSRPSVSVFGTDYPTADGSAVRDYIHVLDLAEAHLLAVDHLVGGGDSAPFNVGSGHGASVLEVIEAVKLVTGASFQVDVEGRRAGDPPELVADISALRDAFGWAPTLSNIAEIVESAWRHIRP